MLAPLRNENLDGGVMMILPLSKRDIDPRIRHSCQKDDRIMTTDQRISTANATSNAFRSLPFMGVIRVNVAAMEVGFRMGHPDWINLGQGQPEVGELEGAPPRYNQINLQPEDHAYGAVEGVDELREAVAAHYNRLYRQGKSSQYTAANVAVAAGGRLALSRCGAALDNVRLGYFRPDYTAYEDLMTTFQRLNPVAIDLLPEDGFRIDPDALDAIVQADGLGALLISNPCNPTGMILQGEELQAWIEMGRRNNCAMLMDEFYSHFNYTDGPSSPPVSSAAYVNDVNEDEVVIFDGLTKCFRYPGWRIGWVVAPESIIQTMTAAGSFVDGGPSRPMQRAAIDILKPERADQETNALRHAFAAKQNLTLERLADMGIKVHGQPQGTFYVYASVADLPDAINAGTSFMHAGFKHQVLTVPGEYFDVNPNRERQGTSPFEQFVRFSFGPPIDKVEQGLDRLAKMIKTY